jgi:hypothetical protein
MFLETHGVLGFGRLLGSETLIWAPHWAFLLLFGVLAAAFGIRAPYRFSLRTLLIVTTLVAVVLSAIAVAR